MSDIDTSHITPAMVRHAKGLKGAKKKATTYRNEFITKLKGKGAAHTVSWETSHLIRSETLAEIEKIIIPTSKSKTTIEERIAWWMEQTERSMEFMKGESRSTSQASNLVEDIQNQVKLRFYSGLLDARRYGS